MQALCLYPIRSLGGDIRVNNGRGKIRSTLNKTRQLKIHKDNRKSMLGRSPVLLRESISLLLKGVVNKKNKKTIEYAAYAELLAHQAQCPEVLINLVLGFVAYAS